MNSEDHPKEIYYLHMLVLLMLVSTLPVKIYPAVNINSQSEFTSFSISNSIEIREVKNRSTFQAIYKHAPISQVVYDLSTFFDCNALILDLEDRLISHEFNECNLNECLEELHHTGRIRMTYGTNFAIFSRSESAVPALGHKINQMNEALLNNNQPVLKLSAYNANLHLVLERILDKSSLDINLSNQLNDRISVHLKSVIPIETLFYIMQYYRLEIRDKDERRIIVPKNRHRY